MKDTDILIPGATLVLLLELITSINLNYLTQKKLCISSNYSFRIKQITPVKHVEVP